MRMSLKMFNILFFVLFLCFFVTSDDEKNSLQY